VESAAETLAPPTASLAHPHLEHAGTHR